MMAPEMAQVKSPQEQEPRWFDTLLISDKAQRFRQDSNMPSNEEQLT